MQTELWNDAAGGFHPASAPTSCPRRGCKEVQLRRLRAVVARAYEHVPLFRQRLEERGLTPDGDPQRSADIAKLPFTVKTDLRDTYPFGLFASPMGDVVRLHASSGTTGKPIVVAYTREDVDVWAEVMVRTFAACGLHRGDILQNAYGYGLFTGGLGAHYGAEALGATVIPISGGNTDRQIMVLKDFGVTALCCTPSYFVHLIERAERAGRRPARPAAAGRRLRRRALDRRHAHATSRPTPGSRPTTSTACPRSSAPAWPASARPRTGCTSSRTTSTPRSSTPRPASPLPDGEEGELVLTTLSKKAMPMIRYRTRDITRIIAEPCACGRTLRRIRRIGRRSDDMFIIRGVNVFPSQVEAALLAGGGDPAALPDHPHPRAGPGPDGGGGGGHRRRSSATRSRALEDVRARLAQAIEHICGIRVDLRLVEPHTIAAQRGQGQARHRPAQRSEQPPRAQHRGVRP